MINHKLSIPLIFSLIVSTGAVAGNANVTISGSIPGFVPIYKSTQGNTLSATPLANKPVIFQHIVLSTQAQHYLAQHARTLGQSTRATLSAAVLPAQVNLDMNNLPVLDQGSHGTCVTFATTGAIDAVHGSSDYISQLCNLELGTYLSQQNADYPSGWDGSWGYLVLDQIQKYGIITMHYQNQYGCAGVRQYPLDEPRNVGKPMSAEDFSAHSEKILKDISYTMLRKPEEAYSPRADEEQLLQQVKQALVNNHRVTFGVMVDINYGGVGAFGTYKTKGDSWVMTPAIKKDAEKNKITAGHEMIIIGYDDNAVITGQHNSKHKGVLILRNSWGNEAGDNGNYYMSYEYFNLLANEAAEIIPTAAS